MSSKLQILQVVSNISAGADLQVSGEGPKGPLNCSTLLCPKG